MPVLYGLKSSPWTAKARWVLEHHRVAYTYREHVPMLGELALRARAGSLLRNATVPLLLDGRERFLTSLEIARHAEANGAGAKLFPAAHDEDIVRLDEEADALLRGARARVLVRVGASPDARRESLPRAMPAAFAPIARLATGFMLRKYGSEEGTNARMAELTRPRLLRLREQLGGRAYFFDALTYADLSVATSLHALRPPREPWCTFGPGTRDAWTHPELADEFEDLLAWRDAVYTAHRQPA